MGTDPFLQRHIMRILLQFMNQFDATTITSCDGNPEAVLAINEQIKIGVGNFCRGIIGWRLCKAQTLYYRSQRNFSSKGETWARKLSAFLIKSSHSIWKQRCDLLSESSEYTYEKSVRKQCKSLLIHLTRNPFKLPVHARHLLKRKPEFTSVASTRALTSWLHRINHGLEQATSGEKHSTSDIRNWFVRKTKDPPTPVNATEEIEFSSSYSTSMQNTTYTSTLPLRTSIRTVPNLPYVPYQNQQSFPSSDSTDIHQSEKTILPPIFTPYRDI